MKTTAEQPLPIESVTDQVFPAVALERMAWARPRFTKEEVKSAGEHLVSATDPETRAEAITIVNNWRTAHSFPLNTLQHTLRTRAREVFGGALVAQRLKRLPAIEAKLRRFERLSLDKLQDIGGCRAIVADCHQVESIVRRYRLPSRLPHEFKSEKDYIKEPKPDGYRSHHMVYRFKGGTRKTRCYDGLQIEIQIRSQMQHAWAAAVETVDMFTGQALKSNAGRPEWSRFFSLMSSYMAQKEATPPVPDTPLDRGELLSELRQHAETLNVIRNLGLWSHVVRNQERVRGAGHFLLEVNAKNGRVQVRGFVNARPAAESYAEAEKLATEGAHVVLVRAASFQAARKAYPSYFSDTKLFVDLVREATSA